MGYWTKRQKQLKTFAEKEERKLMTRVVSYCKAEFRRLDRQIAAYYAAYGEENVVAYRKLLRKLSAEDARLLIEQVEDFVKKYPKYAGLVPIRETIYKLNRLEGLQYSIRMSEAGIAGFADSLTDPYLCELSRRGVNYGMEALGFGTNFYSFNSDIAKQFVDVPWCNGENFSTRIWNNTQKLADALSREIAQGFARGDSYERLTKHLQDRFNRVNRRDVYRLVYTEGTYVMAESSMQPFEQDFQKYKISTAEDGSVCSTCRGVAEKEFRIEDRQPGINFPPFHPWCRCASVVVVDDWDAWLDDYVARHEAADSNKTAQKIAEHVVGEKAAQQLRYKLDIQNFAKSPRDYATIKLPKQEHAAVTHELNTWLWHKEVSGSVIKKPIGNYIYTVQVNGFDDYRILGRTKIAAAISECIKSGKQRR